MTESVLDAGTPAVDAPGRTARAAWSWDSDRWAAVAFGAYLAVAFVLLLTVLGDERWFLGDEWTFLADRRVTSIDDLLQPHNGHWVTLPIIVFRLLFNLVGLNHYWPYEVAIVVTHLTAAALLRLVMRRAGVGAWMATFAAAPFVLLGLGEDNIVWAFQITLVGSLVFGLIQLLLSHHDGPLDRRDWLGLAAGLVSLLCSGTGVVMVFAVGVATLMHRGWRIAAFHTVPLGLVFAAWYLSYRPELLDIGEEDTGNGVLDFVWTGVTHTFEVVGYYWFVGLALAILLVVGLVLAWRPLDRGQFLARAAMPVGLAASGILFLVLVYRSRGAFAFGGATASRYVTVLVACLLPALAVAADAVARRHRLLAPAVVVLLLVGVPGNIAAFEKGFIRGSYFETERRLLTGIARSPLSEQVPRWVNPEPIFVPDVTIGWLHLIDDEGKLPAYEESDPWLLGMYPIRLGVAVTGEPVPDDLECEDVDGALDLDLVKGDRFALAEGVAQVSTRQGDKSSSLPVMFDSRPFGTVMEIQLDEMHLRLEPSPDQTFTYCPIPPDDA